MAIRRLMAFGAAIGLLSAMGLPVAAHGPGDGYSVNVLRTGPSPDADLVNAWGLSRLPGSPWWVADNGTDQSTLYDAAGNQRPLKVAIPGGAPTGTVANAAFGVGDFLGDLFLFDNEAGMIAGWQGGTTATVRNDHSWDGAVFKGLAIGTADLGNGPQQYLYATDFHNRRVDIFDNAYAQVTRAGAFHDPRLPKGYSPFGIQTLNNMVFVTYAKTQPGSNDERAGQGRGVVDAYATNGSFLARVATHGQLNAPWGLALAPSDFGRFSGDLLVGNFGDGQIHAYRSQGHHWRPDGELQGSNRQPIVIDGLWALEFGGGTAKNGHAAPFSALGPGRRLRDPAGALGRAPRGWAACCACPHDRSSRPDRTVKRAAPSGRSPLTGPDGSSRTTTRGAGADAGPASLCLDPRQPPGPNSTVSQRSSGLTDDGAPMRVPADPGASDGNGGAPAAERERDLLRAAKAVAACLLQDERSLLDAPELPLERGDLGAFGRIGGHHRLRPAGRRPPRR